MHHNTVEKHRRIRDRFKKLDAERTPKGKSLYSYEAMLEMVADEFCLSEAYVQKILKQG